MYCENFRNYVVYLQYQTKRVRLAILKVKKFGNVVDVRSVYRPTNKVVFYKLSIMMYENSFSLDGDESLSNKELMFLVACVINFSEGNRKVLSKESVLNYAKIADLPNARSARNYLANSKIKKWIIKTDEGYKLVPFLENLIKSDTTNFNIIIKHDQED